MTSSAASKALRGRIAARGLLEAWSYAPDPEEDRVWCTVMQLYADHGRAPEPTEIAAAADISEERVAVLLDQLQTHDLIGLSPARDIRHAYPFTETDSGHQVELRGRHLRALCAIDALGAGAMYGADTSMTSPCRLCSEAVHVTTAEEGRTLREVSPVNAVVWYDFAYAGSAAASCCPAIAFFCSDEHLRRWLDAQTPPREGVRLAMPEALEVGRATFGPVLAGATLRR